MPEGGGAWLRAVIGIVASPRVSFEIIRQDRPWVGVLALLVFATIVQSLLMRPYTMQASAMVLADFGGSQEELTQMASIGSYAAIAFGVLGLPIGWLFQGLVIWLLAVAFGAEARFSHAFSLAAHLGVVSHLTGWSIPGGVDVARCRGGRIAQRSAGDTWPQPTAVDRERRSKRDLRQHQPLYSLVYGSVGSRRDHRLPGLAAQGVCDRRNLLGGNDSIGRCSEGRFRHTGASLGKMQPSCERCATIQIGWPVQILVGDRPPSVNVP